MASGRRSAGGRQTSHATGGLIVAVVLLLAAACSSPLEGVTVSPSTSSQQQETADATGATDSSSTGGSDDDQASSADSGAAVPVSEQLRVDQFGYLPNDPKVAVIVDPEVGHDSDVDFSPSGSVEVRSWTDDTVVFSGAPEPWQDGALHEQSGDRGWWFDFSTVTEPGSYYLFDPETGVGSGRFDIGEDVYEKVFDSALRMFWHNRANTAHPEEFSGPWADEIAYTGPDQDTEARSVDDQSNPATALDLSGGWFDAGDTNKYVTFAMEPVHLLPTAYRQYPEVFDDSLGIPESANGIPDVIDEVRWEMDWLERMQREDGGVLTKVGLTKRGFESPPSSSDLPRYYEEVCSSSTIAAAGMFAHAALVFGSLPELAGDGERLLGRAVAAWDWYQANEKREDCDPQIVLAGDADLSIDEQLSAEVVAAVYLFALTEDRRYDDRIARGFGSTLPFQGLGFGNYAPDQSDALLFYQSLDSANGTTLSAIESRRAEVLSESPLFGFDPGADLYRSFMPDESYHWGSNMVKANVGSANLALDDGPEARRRAVAHLNYFHGINPVGLVYLSNMGDLGAERSVQALFHFWFGEGSEFDVFAGSEIGTPPGYLVGGPNRWYSGREEPPAGQPVQKSYRDWSASGSEPSWEITEPAIYYQAAYVRLLAAILATAP